MLTHFDTAGFSCKFLVAQLVCVLLVDNALRRTKQIWEGQAVYSDLVWVEAAEVDPFLVLDSFFEVGEEGEVDLKVCSHSGMKYLKQK